MIPRPVMSEQVPAKISTGTNTFSMVQWEKVFNSDLPPDILAKILETSPINWDAWCLHVSKKGDVPQAFYHLSPAIPLDVLVRTHRAVRFTPERVRDFVLRHPENPKPDAALFWVDVCRGLIENNEELHQVARLLDPLARAGAIPVLDVPLDVTLEWAKQTVQPAAQQSIDAIVAWRNIDQALSSVLMGSLFVPRPAEMTSDLIRSDLWSDFLDKRLSWHNHVHDLAYLSFWLCQNMDRKEIADMEMKPRHFLPFVCNTTTEHTRKTLNRDDLDVIYDVLSASNKSDKSVFLTNLLQLSVFSVRAKESIKLCAYLIDRLFKEGVMPAPMEAMNLSVYSEDMVTPSSIFVHHGEHLALSHTMTHLTLSLLSRVKDPRQLDLTCLNKYAECLPPSLRGWRQMMQGLAHGQTESLSEQSWIVYPMTKIQEAEVAALGHEYIIRLNHMVRAHHDKKMLSAVVQKPSISLQSPIRKI